MILPTPQLLAEFRKWVEETGEPHAWYLHDPSTPPRDQDFEELLRFEIPEKLHPRVGKAPCPICSPTAPKYFEGALAWFPKEGVFRAIGRECARSHFGVERYNAAIALRRNKEAKGRAEDFLLDALPRLAGFRDEVARLESVAGDVDSVRQLFWRHSSKTACQSLARLSQGGQLIVQESREIQGTDAYGKSQQRRETLVVATFAVSGIGFLSSKGSILAMARNAATALEELPAIRDPEEALQFVCNLLTDDRLLQTEKLLRSINREVEALREAIGEARACIEPENLAALSDWSADHRSGAPLAIHFDGRWPNRVRVGKPGHGLHPISIPSSIR